MHAQSATRKRWVYAEHARRKMTIDEKEDSPSTVHDHLTAELLLTSECNMACSYCIAGGLPRATLSVENGKQAIDMFVRLSDGASSVEIVLTGGEPFLVFPLAERLIRYAEEQTRAAGIDSTFVIKTNGTILNDAIIDFIHLHGLKVVVSIDGIPSVHDRHRRTKQNAPTHSLVLQNLMELLKLDIQCVASVTVHPDACGMLFDSICQLHTIGIEQIDVGPAYDTVNWSESDVATLIDSIMAISRYTREVRSAGSRLEVGPIYRSTEHVGEVLKDIWGCRAASTNLAFMPNGQITGCSALAMLTTRYPWLIIGDIASGMYGDALNQFLEIAQAGEQQRSHCHSCEAARNCAGGCLAINLAQNGSPFSPPQFYCRAISIIPLAWRYVWDDGTECGAPMKRRKGTREANS